MNADAFVGFSGHCLRGIGMAKAGHRMLLDRGFEAEATSFEQIVKSCVQLAHSSPTGQRYDELVWWQSFCLIMLALPAPSPRR